MNILTIIFIAFSLALDAFAASIVSGVAIKNLRANHALKIAVFFGGFQAFMPIVGWLSGVGLKNFISGFDHWIAFGILSFIGCKIIYEAVKREKNKEKDPLNIYVLLILAIATSIDALAVGISFAFLGVSIILPVIVIGIVTFLLSFLGVFIGNKVGHFFESKIEIAAGLILIVIGLRILLQHLL